ncbi:hypothetical protein ACFQ8T_13795 [Isoptericola sp. NPDC056618]|uniref:hypothetical protein n=1 Tax=Isoptericola sp. NPDC056618 TaxID=3345878 RepID=UPI0036C42176
MRTYRVIVGKRAMAALAGIATLVTGAVVGLATPAAADGDGETHRIFATREGLVGKHTANGHKISTRDHFVALPSRRALSADGDGAFSVRACRADSTRCEYAPVWDVGPWNTTDDYWSSTRHAARDLPRGTPQASAAYRLGHHGGKDLFGRTVTNPAGIDLADGTYRDSLGLRSNAWIDVTYLWQGSARTGIVSADGGTLNVRTGPGTGYRWTGAAADAARVPLLCHARGQTVTGTRGTTNLWYRIGPSNWVSDAYLATGSGGALAPAC